MTKKMASLPPLLEPELAKGLVTLGQLLQRRLLAYQTVTVLFENLDSDADPKSLPALMISKLPYDVWVLEVPLPPLSLRESQPKYDFFLFNSWLGPNEEIAASFSCGPKKVIQQALGNSFESLLLSAVEDLLLVSSQCDARRILVADNHGEVSDYFGNSLKKLIAECPGTVALLPPNSSFFTDSGQDEGPIEEQMERAARKFAEVEVRMEEKKIRFYATSCYLGVPRNLFIFDYSSEELRVSVWNGTDFVACHEEHTVQAIRRQGEEPQPGGPKEISAMSVYAIWPNALKKLSLPLLRPDEEL